MRKLQLRKWVLMLMACIFLAYAVITSMEFTVTKAVGTAPVTVYSDAAFCGIKQDFTVGSHNVNELTVNGGVGNDSIESIRVAPGYKVTLYSDMNYSGNSEVIRANRRSISLANVVSSFVVETVPEHLPVTVYSDSEFSGTAQEFDVGDYGWSDIQGVVGNDTISSVRVAPGYQVTLYKDAGYAGGSVILKQDYNNLKTINFNDVTSSLKVTAISPLDNTCIEISSFDDTTKISLLEQFAPKIWMASGESYWASSVEWAMEYLERYYDTGVSKYCLRTKQTLSSPTQKLPFFSGNQSSARCYAFWTEKDYNNIDLSYWQYCPYNFGKVVLGMEFGNHVGDWEHVTIRLAKFSYNGVDYVKPTMVLLPYHSSFIAYRWSELDKVSGTNHPIVYSAKESHGMWKDPGNHVYQNIVIAQLTDVCSAGTAMDCWDILNTYQYDPSTLSGRGLGTTSWPSYFDTEYDSSDGSSVYRWGNPKQGSVFGQDILGNGPAGPEGHDALYDWIILR